MIEMHVTNISLGADNKAPIVFLKEIDGETILPIQLGALEALTISIILNKETLSRPLTHDLFIMTLNSLKSELLNVEISSIKDGIYYAFLIIRGPKGRVRIDCRPSDAITLALLAQSPILVSKSVLYNSDNNKEHANDKDNKNETTKSIDSATHMLRKADAQKKIDLLNAMLRSHGTLSNCEEQLDSKKLYNLLHFLEPASNRKM